MDDYYSVSLSYIINKFPKLGIVKVTKEQLYMMNGTSGKFIMKVVLTHFQHIVIAALPNWL